MPADCSSAWVAAGAAWSPDWLRSDFVTTDKPGDQDDATAPGLLPRLNAFEHAPNARTIWGWVQLVGLALLAAGVAVLVAFALMLGGR